MNQTQAFRQKFPGIEVKDNPFIPNVRKRCFTAYQTEANVIRCLKDALSDMDNWKCNILHVKHGEHWWDCDKFSNKGAALCAMFEHSLARYITKFSVERNTGNMFELWFKVHDLGGLDTNIGPDLVEYIGSLFA